MGCRDCGLPFRQARWLRGSAGALFVTCGALLPQNRAGPDFTRPGLPHGVDARVPQAFDPFLAGSVRFRVFTNRGSPSVASRTSAPTSAMAAAVLSTISTWSRADSRKGHGQEAPQIPVGIQIFLPLTNARRISGVIRRSAGCEHELRRCQGDIFPAGGMAGTRSWRGSWRYTGRSSATAWSPSRATRPAGWCPGRDRAPPWQCVPNWFRTRPLVTWRRTSSVKKRPRGYRLAEDPRRPRRAQAYPWLLPAGPSRFIRSCCGQ